MRTKSDATIHTVEAEMQSEINEMQKELTTIKEVYRLTGFLPRHVGGLLYGRRVVSFEAFTFGEVGRLVNVFRPQMINNYLTFAGRDDLQTASPFVMEFQTYSHAKNETEVRIHFKTDIYHVDIIISLEMLDRGLMGSKSKELSEALHEKELARYRRQPQTYSAPCLSVVPAMNYAGASIINYAENKADAAILERIVLTGQEV